MSFLDKFSGNKKRKKRLANILGKGKGEESQKNSGSIPVLDDMFVEQSVSMFASLKKTPFANFSEFIETQRTAITVNKIFVIEILHECVNAAIVSRQGVFLDIGFLKTYSFDDLKEIYFKITGSMEDLDETFNESIESIISIISYDIIYALPTKIVVIEATHSDLLEINVAKGRFMNEKDTHSVMMRELSSYTGYEENDIIYSAIKRSVKKDDKEIGYIISLVEKTYCQGVESYLEDAGFQLKKLHSLKSALYSSFSLESKNSKMRLHVVGESAYGLVKARGREFEYFHYVISADYETLEIHALEVDEVILSGDGAYYDMLKTSLLEVGAKVRWWNYAYDLNRAILRVDKSISLNNGYANIISTAYYELFNARLAVIRLGVSTKLSAYEFLAANLNLLPFAMILTVILLSSAYYFYLKYELETLQNNSQGYVKLEQSKKSLEANKQTIEKNINTINQKKIKITDVLGKNVNSPDATILYEIAQKIPSDIILISVKKMQTSIGKNKFIESIQVVGKCYHEESLLQYIESIQLGNQKKVYLVSLEDKNKKNESKQSTSKFEKANKEKVEAFLAEVQKAQKEASLRTSEGENLAPPPQFNAEQKQYIDFHDALFSEEKVYYSDTLNNTFTLEIK